MYGTIGKFVAKPGQAKALEQVGRRWQAERSGDVPGFIGHYVLVPDDQPDVSFTFVIFDSPESYRANAADPEQDVYYQELRRLVSTEPEWTDGAILDFATAAVRL